jgi:hypothetical protein
MSDDASVTVLGRPGSDPGIDRPKLDSDVHLPVLPFVRYVLDHASDIDLAPGGISKNHVSKDQPAAAASVHLRRSPSDQFHESLRHTSCATGYAPAIPELKAEMVHACLPTVQPATEPDQVESLLACIYSDDSNASSDHVTQAHYCLLDTRTTYPAVIDQYELLA